MQWIRFYYNDKELTSYTLNGSFPGEYTATLHYHAFELKCKVEEIKAYVIEKNKKVAEVLKEIEDTGELIVKFL